jgi:hypothetical protein
LILQQGGSIFASHDAVRRKVGNDSELQSATDAQMAQRTIRRPKGRKHNISAWVWYPSDASQAQEHFQDDLPFRDGDENDNGEKEVPEEQETPPDSQSPSQQDNAPPTEPQ